MILTNGAQEALKLFTVDFNKNEYVLIPLPRNILFHQNTTIRNSRVDISYFGTGEKTTKEISFLLFWEFLLFSHLSEQIAWLRCYVLGRALFTELWHGLVSTERNRWRSTLGEIRQHLLFRRDFSFSEKNDKVFLWFFFVCVFFPFFSELFFFSISSFLFIVTCGIWWSLSSTE